MERSLIRYGRIAVVALIVVVCGALVNALITARMTRTAEPFAGGHVLELDGPDLNVREYGPPGQRAIVLLHGYTASIQWWEKVAPQLARNQRVIAIDLVGHGGSESPRDTESFQAYGQANAVHNALNALGVRQAVLIGHSMGGWVATAMTERFPELIERVVTVDTPAANDLIDMPLQGRTLCWPLIGPAMDHLRHAPFAVESTLQTGFAADYPVPDIAYRSLARMTYTGACESLRGQRPETAATLVALKKPTLIVYGERDVLDPVAPSVERYRAEGLPPRIIAGSGHTPMIEKPDEFLAAVQDFVSGAASHR